jgi:hypothetical protein
VRETGHIDGFELLEITRVETWVSSYQYLGVDDRLRPSVSILRNTDKTLALLELSLATVLGCRITDTEQQSRFRNKNATPLFVSLVDHAGILLFDQTLQCRINWGEAFQKELFSQFHAIYV